MNRYYSSRSFRRSEALRGSTGAVWGAVLLPLCFSLVSAAPPGAVGQLLDVKGSVEIERARQPVRRGTLLLQLEQGDLLRLREGGSAQVVLFRNGARFSLSGTTTARVGLTDLKPVVGAAPHALRRLSPALASGMSRPIRPISPRFLGVLVRDPGEPGVGPRDPSPNGAVRGAPVTLRWAGPVEGEGLRLQIRDGEQTIHSVELPPMAREYQVAAGLLRPGQYYVWSVIAVREGESGPRCRALLRLLAPGEKAELEELERESAGARTSSPDTPASLLLLAQAYERFGLLDDAQTAYQEALHLRPGDPGVQAALKRLGRGSGRVTESGP
jgi:hypothetical protein